MEKAVPLVDVQCGATGEVYKQAEVDMPSRIKAFTFRMIGVDANGKLVSVTTIEEGNTMPDQEHTYIQTRQQAFCP